MNIRSRAKYMIFELAGIKLNNMAKMNNISDKSVLTKLVTMAITADNIGTRIRIYPLLHSFKGKTIVSILGLFSICSLIRSNIIPIAITFSPYINIDIGLCEYKPRKWAENGIVVINKKNAAL